MRFGSLCTGIGGADKGLEDAGMRCEWQVEIDPWRRRVLAKHWPEVPRFADIRGVGRHNLLPVDLITAGFPCQPFSVAGQRRGEADDRYLWPEVLRVIQEIRPAWCLLENVPGIIGMALDTVLSDLEAANYEAAPLVIPACAVGAPHRRDRVWVVAYADSGRTHTEQKCWPELPNTVHVGRYGALRNVADTNQPPEGYGNNDVRLLFRNTKGKRQKGSTIQPGESWPVEPSVGRVADGIPHRVDRLSALGDAIVPQVVTEIGRYIVAAHEAQL